MQGIYQWEALIDALIPSESQSLKEEGILSEKGLRGCQCVGNGDLIFSFLIIPAIVQRISKNAFSNPTAYPGACGLDCRLAQGPAQKPLAGSLPNNILNGDCVRAGDEVTLGNKI